MKTCSKCGGEVEALYAKYGRICRKCRSKASTERNRKNPAMARAAGARWRAANHDYYVTIRRVHSWRLQGIQITYEQYQAMRAAQGDRCAICRTKDPGRQDFHVDHDHKFGHCRGLLCGRCNRVLGAMGDDARLLRAAAKYLESRQPVLPLALAPPPPAPRRGRAVGDRNGARLHPELHPRGEQSPLAKVTADQVRFIRAERAKGRPLHSLAAQFGLTIQGVHRIEKRKSWAWLDATATQGV